jgi:hypothetical protein
MQVIALVVGFFWLTVLTGVVGWQMASTPRSTGETEVRLLLCEDALARRRDSDQALARVGRERQGTLIDAKRLTEMLEKAEAEVAAYCGPVTGGAAP